MEAQGDGTPVWGFHPACDVPATTRMKLPGSRISSNLSIVVESIIFQQHLRAACAPVTAEEDDKVRCLVRWPSGRISIDEPSPRRECMWHAPSTTHEASPRSRPVRLHQFKSSA